MPVGQLTFATVNICVTEQGTVSRVRILSPSIPVLDAQLPLVIGRWRYRPYLIDARPTAFCYSMNYRVK